LAKQPNTTTRNKLFRRMLLNKEKPVLAMASWALRLEHDSSFSRWHNKGLMGMSLAGMSDLEHEVMTAWCRVNGAIHVTRRKRFEEFLHHSFCEQIINLPEDPISITYMEEEVVVVGTAKFIAHALKFTQDWPKRRHTCYVTNTTSKEIRKEMRGSNFRAVRIIDDPDAAWLLSTDDRERLFQFWVRS
jgi:hypothetical protein